MISGSCPASSFGVPHLSIPLNSTFLSFFIQLYLLRQKILIALIDMPHSTSVNLSYFNACFCFHLCLSFVSLISVFSVRFKEISQHRGFSLSRSWIFTIPRGLDFVDPTSWLLTVISFSCFTHIHVTIRTLISPCSIDSGESWVLACDSVWVILLEGTKVSTSAKGVEVGSEPQSLWRRQKSALLQNLYHLIRTDVKRKLHMDLTMYSIPTIFFCHSISRLRKKFLGSLVWVPRIVEFRLNLFHVNIVILREGFLLSALCPCCYRIPGSWLVLYNPCYQLLDFLALPATCRHCDWWLLLVSRTVVTCRKGMSVTKTRQ